MTDKTPVPYITCDWTRSELIKKLNLIPREENVLLSGVPDYFYRNKISSGGDLSHYSSASLY